MSEVYAYNKSLAVDVKTSPVAPSATQNGSSVRELVKATQIDSAQTENTNAKKAKAEDISLNLVKATKSETEVLRVVAERVQAFIPSAEDNTTLSINKDDITGLFIYRALDKESGEVVRQFPQEQILNLLHAKRRSEGLVVDNKA